MVKVPRILGGKQMYRLSVWIFGKTHTHNHIESRNAISPNVVEMLVYVCTHSDTKPYLNEQMITLTPAKASLLPFYV